MSLETPIKETIGKLNAEWFIGVKTEFEQSPFYDKGSKTIDDAIEYPLFWDAETGEEDEEKRKRPETITIQSTLPEYSWKGLPLSLSGINPDEEPIYKARSLANEILDAAAVLLKEASGINERQQVILAVTQSMRDEADSLKSSKKDGDYHTVIDYCISQLIYQLTHKYWATQRAHDTISEFEDRLVFDLKQKELAFLLAILIRAGFLAGANEKGATFNHFFSKYFYFKNQREGNSFTRAIAINKKISDALSSGNTDYLSIKPDIKTKLLDAISSL
jgi:hypothetical protein